MEAPESKWERLRSFLGPPCSEHPVARVAASGEHRVIVRVFQREHAFGRVDAVEFIYFIAALVLLSALMYGSLNHHLRDRRKDRHTDQMVRDRYHHNRM